MGVLGEAYKAQYAKDMEVRQRIAKNTGKRQPDPDRNDLIRQATAVSRRVSKLGGNKLYGSEDFSAYSTSAIRKAISRLREEEAAHVTATKQREADRGLLEITHSEVVSGAEYLSGQLRGREVEPNFKLGILVPKTGWSLGSRLRRQHSRREEPIVESHTNPGGGTRVIESFGAASAEGRMLSDNGQVYGFYIGEMGLAHLGIRYRPELPDRMGHARVLSYYRPLEQLDLDDIQRSAHVLNQVSESLATLAVRHDVSLEQF